MEESLVVLGEEWKIVTERLHDKRGECDGVDRTITLDPVTSGREDLLHETIHAIENSLNLELEEYEVQAVARGLWQTCRENPWFVQYLAGKKPRKA